MVVAPGPAALDLDGRHIMAQKDASPAHQAGEFSQGWRMTAFDYTAEGFSEERFRECGAMVAVVMNYDKRGLVGRAVESAFAQDWPCYEILAIDDASTDGSGEEMLSSVRRCVEANPAKTVRARAVLNRVFLSGHFVT